MADPASSARPKFPVKRPTEWRFAAPIELDRLKRDGWRGVRLTSREQDTIARLLESQAERCGNTRDFPDMLDRTRTAERTVPMRRLFRGEVR